MRGQAYLVLSFECLVLSCGWAFSIFDFRISNFDLQLTPWFVNRWSGYRIKYGSCATLREGEAFFFVEGDFLFAGEGESRTILSF